MLRTIISVLSALLATTAVQAQPRHGGRPGGFATFHAPPPPVRSIAPLPAFPGPAFRHGVPPLAPRPFAPFPYFNRGYYGWYGGFGGNYYGLYGGDFGYPGYYAQPSYQSFYTEPVYVGPTNSIVPLAPVAENHPTTAQLTLQAPVGAEVLINGKKMEGGANRTFESPELQPGQKYTFDVKLSWMENGKKVEESRTVTMGAGEHQSLQYLAQPARPVRLDK